MRFVRGMDMEIRNLYNNIYIDPLTCLPNFFRFIESDFEEIFDEKGVILIFDIANMKIINQNFGGNTGDLYIKTLSDVISNEFSEFNNAAIFRTHGDEFTVIFKNIQVLDIEAICNIVKVKFISAMNEKGFIDVNVNILTLGYNNPIYSVENYYEILLRGFTNQEEKKQNKYNREKLLKHIIGGVINRVKETLSYYNDACSLAFVDDISGLPNHRAGKIHLSDLLEGYKSDKNGFSLLFIDGDDLKRYNKVSYDTGNDMIRRLSGIIADTLRNEDKIFRWLSGDEFLIVLNETNDVKAIKIAERIRQAVEEQTRSWIYPVTISIGIACYPKDGCCITELIDKAEKANGLAKDAGKNRVVMWNTTKI
jgi:diguanylate cyclase (GGDEF)-like protein